MLEFGILGPLEVRRDGQLVASTVFTEPEKAPDALPDPNQTVVDEGET